MSAEYNCPPICRDCQRAHRGPCQPDGLRSLALAPCSALSAATKPEKINVRLFDLVRYMRSELHAANLISEEEYWWLCHECDLAKGGGSPSPRRLEDYDLMRRRLAALEKPNTGHQPRAERTKET